ncbi:MAG TPA: hypothetical protein VK961_04845 [Chthoniobacter sp.]|nr:hypothetical protein [Chthoniobacter sp.]
MPSDLQPARKIVLAWLRADHREPTCLAGEADAVLDQRHAEITQRFLKWAKIAGFDYEVIEGRADGRTAYAVHWTHRGASFVGFKQPPSEATVEDALLAGSAALLENQWCRKWLDQ